MFKGLSSDEQSVRCFLDHLRKFSLTWNVTLSKFQNTSFTSFLSVFALSRSLLISLPRQVPTDNLSLRAA